MPEFIRWILYNLERATIRMLSVYRWVIFILPIDDEQGGRLENSHLEDSYTLREALDSDIESIIEVYPKEFFKFMPRKKRDNLVRSRFKSGCTGFILLNGLGKVVGATWALPAKSAATIEFNGNAFELVNTFVVPSERGTGLGSFLRSRVISEMAQKGFSYVISYVWRSRKASIRMNLSTGSRIVAEKKRINFLGFHKTYIEKCVDLCGIVSLPHIILLGKNSERMKLAGAYFKSYGFSVNAILYDAQSLDHLKISNMVKNKECVLIFDNINYDKIAEVKYKVDKDLKVINEIFPEFSFDDLIEDMKMECNRTISLTFSASGVSSPVIDLS